MSARFVQHARTVSGLTLLSRLTGLARDATLSRVFGASALMDAFFLAFMIPNLFRRLFGEGALAAAFLPAYARLQEEEPATAARLASLTVSRLMILLGAVVLAGEALLYALSLRADGQTLPIWLAMIMLPYMPMVCLVAILGAMLQVHGRFGPTAAAPIVLNLALIAAAAGGGLLLADGAAEDRLLHIGGVAGAVVVAGILQVLWSLFALRGRADWRRDTGSARAPFRRVVGQMLPMILGLGVLQLNTLFDGLIASYPTAIGPTILGVEYPLREGAMATVSFAQRLYQFPLGVFGIAVATAIFPALARQRDDEHAFSGIVRRGLRLVVFIGLPASAGLVLVRAPLTAVILEGRAFSAADTARTGFVLLGYAPAIWAYAMTHVLTRAFFAREDSRTPVRVAVAVVGLNLVLNCSLIWTPLREAGLAWSTAICSIVQVIALLVLLGRRIGSLVDRSVGVSWGRSLLATILMSGGVIAAGALGGPADASWLQTLGHLLLLVMTGAAIYAAVALVLRMEELPWSIGRSS